MSQAGAPAQQVQPGHWHAAIDLRLVQAAGRTRLRRGPGYGPLYVQKPFYPEGPVCHLYLLHPPAGIVGGDRLQCSATLDPGAQLLLTTPAASKHYRSTGARSAARHDFAVADDASLEFLPQETIVFAGAQSCAETHIALTGSARCVAWDILCLGQPASGEAFTSGRYRQAVTITHRPDPDTRARPLLIDRQHWTGDGPELQAPWGLNGAPCLGTFYAARVDEDLLNLLRTRTDTALALTCVQQVLIARARSDSAAKIKTAFEKLWQDLRPLLLQRAAQAPRIWNT